MWPDIPLTRSAFRWLILTVLLVGDLTVISAQEEDRDRYRPPIEIQNVRLGLPGNPTPGVTYVGAPAGIFRAGKFAPVYFDLRCNSELGPKLWATVETTDSTGLSHSYTVPVPPLQKGQSLRAEELTNLPYIKPGSSSAELRVRISEGPTPEQSSEIRSAFREQFNGVYDPNTVVMLTIGSRPSQFELPERQNTSGYGNSSPRVVISSVDRFGVLPDQWFGYDGVDVVVLPTGGLSDEQFAAEPFLNNEIDIRRTALLEWVSRGGNLIVSLGRNTSAVAQRQALMDFLPVSVRRDLDGQSLGKREVPQVTFRWQETAAGSFRAHTLRFENGDPVILAELEPKPNRAVRSMMDGELIPTGKLPILFQAPHGRGRISVVAFDLDGSALAETDIPASFWEWLLSNTSGKVPLETQSNYGFGYGSSNSELASLQSSLDTFEGVPVISFGWVALFILGYILIIGPLDYFVLKKVFKRLELTWITFPLVVVAVSLAAYFTAYSLKGKDLRINKLDVVDIDLRDGRIYGTTWVTVFSPRIQSYDVGLVPNSGTYEDDKRWQWSSASPESTSKHVLMTWAGETSQERESLFRRNYSYYVNTDEERFATGLENVPIQVWSTKAFEANWAAPIPNDPFPIVSDLRHPPADPESLTGSITNQLPIPELHDAHLIYRGEVYKLGTMVRGIPTPVVIGRAGRKLDNWLRESGYSEPVAKSYDGYGESGDVTTSTYRLWTILFHEAGLTAGRDPNNPSTRRLDDSWRASESNRAEAMLIARVPTHSGPAEQVCGSALSPTQLWLNAIPGTRNPDGTPVTRQPLQGTLRQETYIRVYIPIQDAQSESNQP